MTSTIDRPVSSRHRNEWTVLVFAIVWPTILTLLYFVWTKQVSSRAQQFTYFAGKFIQFGLPFLWVGIVCRERMRWPEFTSRGLGKGIAFGLVVSAVMFALYFTWLKPDGVFAKAGSKMLDELSGIGVTSPARYAVVAIFYSLIHSLLEEYYWRWFVFGRMRNLLPLVWAIGISSLAFMCHHVIVLSLYFGPANSWTWFFSLATAVGGAVWAWLYHRTGSIYGPWASHLIIDATIFGIGYDLIRAAAQQ